jgi:menaquinone-9 beta-reductase
MDSSPLTTEALIVGGGPAGLAASIALRQHGIDCVVVEARSPGIDKACGEGLMPDSLKALGSLGVHLSESDGHAFHGIRYANSAHRVDATFPHGAGLGIRRPRLHSLLAEQAGAAGARLLWDSHIKLAASPSPGATGQTAQINGQPIRFRWLIGADGEASSVRRWARLDAARKQEVRYGFRRHYQVAPWSDFVEVYWGASGQFYVTPVARDCVGVVFITRDRRRKPTSDSGSEGGDPFFDFPEIAGRLSGAPMVSQQRGAVSATRRLHRVATESVALIGDASGSVDAITGEGMALAFRQAHALAEAIASGSLNSYQTAHRNIGRLPHAMGWLMLTLDRWPALQTRAMQALAGNPGLFQDLLSAHVGAKGLWSVSLRSGPSFGWNLLTRPPIARGTL